MYNVCMDKLQAWKELMAVIRRLMGRGELTKCEKLLNQALEQGLQIFGANRGEVGLVYVMLTQVCEQQGNMGQAEQYRNEADRITALYKLDEEV